MSAERDDHARIMGMLLLDIAVAVAELEWVDRHSILRRLIPLERVAGLERHRTQQGRRVDLASFVVTSHLVQTTHLRRTPHSTKATDIVYHFL